MITDLPDSGEPVDGGVQAVSSCLVTELARLESIDLHVVTFRLGLQSPRTVNRENYVHHLIPVGRLGTITGFAVDQARLNHALAEIRPDVVHSQGAGHLGILAARSKFPCVTTIHGIQSREASFQPTLHRRLRSHLQSWLANYHCIRRATHTILISPYVAEHYGTQLGGRHYSIPNPVDAGFFDVVRHEEPNRILFLGRLYALKGIHNLIRAAEKLSLDDKLHITLAGSIADVKYVEELRALAKQLGLADSLHIAGILPITEVQAEYSRCSCLVLPSYQETAPMVIQEAMASGVPVIASNICGIPHQVIDGRTGFLVPAGDVDALAHRLELLLSDSNMRQEMGIAARKKAKTEYWPAAVAQRTLEVYRQVLQ